MGDLEQKIKQEEGFCGKVYACTENKLTIGYGFNLESSEMPVEVADIWLTINLNKLNIALLSEFWWFKGLDEGRRIVVVDMAYQMGVRGLKGFKGMIAAIIDRDYERAAYELLDSKYARQTPNRANRNAEIMRTGNI